MTFNLGVSDNSSLSNNEQFMNEALEVLLDNGVYDEPDPYFALDNLIEINKALAVVNYSQEALFVLAHDKVFKDIISSGPNPKVSLNAFIQTSEENLMQDFLIAGPIGPVFGAFLERLKRIKKVLNKAISEPLIEDRFNSRWKSTALYLPNFKETQDILKGLRLIHTSIIAVCRDPKLNIAPIITSLNKLGYNVTEAGLAGKRFTVDWRQVAISAVATAMTILTIGSLSAIAPITQQTGNVIGLAWGIGAMYAAQNLAKNKGSLYEKGYNINNLRLCSKELISHIDKIPELKKGASMSISDLKTIDNASGKIRFIKSVTKLYIHTVKNLGRGLTEAYQVARMKWYDKI